MSKLRLGRHKLSTPAICGSVVGKNLAEMRAGVARALKQGADLVELRVDGLRDQAGWEKLLQKNLPVILTNRPRREGGGFNGGEEERVGLLLDGIGRGVSCVDIELSTPKKLRDQVVSKAKRSGATVLMSHHDFSKTPPAEMLVGALNNIVRAGCDIAKLVTLAKSADDAFRMLDFLIQIQKATPVPVVAFAMGDAGRITRLVAPIFGSPIVYAAAGVKTAPGQLDVTTTKQLLCELVPREVKL